MTMPHVTVQRELKNVVNDRLKKYSGDIASESYIYTNIHNYIINFDYYCCHIYSMSL